MTLAFLLRSSAEDSERSEIFTGVFFIIWCAAALRLAISNSAPFLRHPSLNIASAASPTRFPTHPSAGAIVITLNNKLLGGTL